MSTVCEIKFHINIVNSCTLAVCEARFSWQCIIDLGVKIDHFRRAIVVLFTVFIRTCRTVSMRVDMCSYVCELTSVSRCDELSLAKLGHSLSVITVEDGFPLFSLEANQLILINVDRANTFWLSTV